MSDKCRKWSKFFDIPMLWTPLCQHVITCIHKAFGALKNAIAEWELALLDSHSNVSTIENRGDISIMVKMVEDSGALLHRCFRHPFVALAMDLILHLVNYVWVDVIARHEFINTRPNFAASQKRSNDSSFQTNVLFVLALALFSASFGERHLSLYKGHWSAWSVFAFFKETKPLHMVHIVQRKQYKSLGVYAF